MTGAEHGGRPGSLSPRERIDRSRSRAWALETLYRWESEDGDRSPVETLLEVVKTRNLAARRQPRVRLLLATVRDNLAAIDAELTAVTRNWRIDRLSRIDRSVLRIGAAELLFLDDVPPPVAIQESVRLASRYGGNESAGFVNGVLDALHRRNVAREGKDAPGAPGTGES
ncbi:MAG: transcription antitermination factor NusB [Gemmatimonadales bacterium]|nr:MAG: transcription antitermination factor NusB [Gemmatimonadales bacterium]